ncbi:hypothetical protein Tco_0242941 [Tanacetum coccineum]
MELPVTNKDDNTCLLVNRFILYLVELKDRKLNDGVSSHHSMNSRPLSSKEGGSILDVMEEIIKVGQTMGYNMEVGLLVLTEKCDLWNYLRSLIDRWDGETVIMGDFNKVRYEHERSTWKSMHVTDSNGLDLQELNYLDASEISQKAKVHWSIEGDENSKYFHGILNKKRSQLAIRGTLVNGEWISNPFGVKREFYSHFKNQFSAFLLLPRLSLDFDFSPKRYPLIQSLRIKRIGLLMTK